MRSLREALVGAACLLVMATILLEVAPAAAQSPALLPVQGALLDGSGNPISGTLEVTFAIYGDGTGAAQIWSETQTVSFDQGVFAAYLGSVVPLSLATFRDYPATYLGVTVGDDAEMDLVRLATAPYAGYALLCGDSATLGGSTLTQVYDEFETRAAATLHARYTDDEARDAMGALSDGNSLNHHRFSPSDAVASMGAVGDGNPLNHDRYADGEAVAAMGNLGDGNPLNHSRYTDGEAVAAMGDLGDGNALNHDRYTDAEAVAAVSAGDLTVQGTLRAAAIEAPGCRPGFTRLSGDAWGTCIQINPGAEAGCFNDECFAAGMRSCECAEVKLGLHRGFINPTTDVINPAGEYCLSGLGHCQGNGTTCTSGSGVEISKIWPNPANPTAATQWYNIASEGGVAVCDVARPTAHAGYPYGSYRCCY